MLCAKCPISLEIVLDAPNGPPWYRIKWMLISVRFGIVLILMHGTCIVCTKHNIALEIIFDAPDGISKRRGSSGSSIQSVWR
jgi:hypothetical protein